MWVVAIKVKKGRTGAMYCGHVGLPQREEVDRTGLVTDQALIMQDGNGVAAAVLGVRSYSSFHLFLLYTNRFPCVVPF